MRSDLVRSICSEALAKIFEGQLADRVLDRALRRHRELASDERAAVARRVLGIACLRGRLDYRLDLACPDWRDDPMAFRLAAYTHDEEGTEGVEASGIAAPRIAGLGGPVTWPDDPVARLAAQHSLPHWLALRLHQELGPDAARLAEASNRPGPVTLRVNSLKTTRGALAVVLAGQGIATRPTLRSPWGLTVEGRANLFGSQAWREGLFEVQDEGSQLLALAVGARPGERVIDFCAGAGGKTLPLAAAMEDRGELLALDVDPQRLVNLKSRLERAGVTIVQAQRIEPGLPLPDLAPADRVLVDAPCSSLGTLRRSPDLRWRLRPGEIPAFARTQSEILGRAATCVRPGGLLVYATCTLTPEENDGVAAAFLNSHCQWRVEGEPLRLWPHVHGTDGFFACAFRRP